MADSRRMGILSRTLNPSLTVRWILPARIRSRTRNDVVFVGNTYVMLREFLPDGQLADPIARLDLDTQILAAKVISAKLQVVPILDAILNQERDEFRYEIDGRPVNESQPPQILVLSTSAAELIYVYAKDVSSTRARFIFARRHLLGPTNTSDRYGRHMAIDPESRAMAVAPSSNSLAVFQLKAIDQIKSEIDRCECPKTEAFKPILEQRYIQVDGYILKMEFLKSPVEDPDRVILVLLVSHGGWTRILLYRWDSHGPLYRMRPMRNSGERLPPQDSFPLLLIPSSRYPSFFIVTESSVVLLDNVHSTRFARIPDAQLASRSRLPGGTALWVQWAKPIRHKEYMGRQDDFVLVREDGLVKTYLISHKSDINIEAKFDVGGLGIKVDTAFCMLAGPIDKGGDVIIAGGDGTDGGVFHIRARDVPMPTQGLPNTAPVQDLLIIEPSQHPTTRPPRIQPLENQVFISLDRGETGSSIAELHIGLEARVACNVAYPDASSIDRLWVLKRNDPRHLWLLISHVLHTSLLAFDLQTHEIHQADNRSFPGFDFEHPTLAAAGVDDHCIVQVTNQSISFCSTKFESKHISTIDDLGSRCINAFLPDNTTLLFTVHKSEQHYRVNAIPLHAESISAMLAKATTLLMQDLPISFTFAKLGGGGLLILGTDTGMLRGFFLYGEESPQVAFRHSIGDFIENQEMLPISSLTLLSHPSSSTALLLCGLRNGLLIFLKLKLHVSAAGSYLDVQYSSERQLGTTAVHCAPATTLGETSSSALCMSQHVLMRVIIHPNSSGPDFDVCKILFTKQGRPLEKPPLMHFVYDVPHLSRDSDAGASGFIICAIDDNLLFASQVMHAQISARHIPVKGRPRKITYSRFLNRIVVAAEHKMQAISSGTPRQSRLEPRFIAYPILQLVGTTPRVGSEEKNPDSGFTKIGEAEEQITSLTNWRPTDGQMHFEMIVVAVVHVDPESRRPTGRVLCISAKPLGRGLLTQDKIKAVARYPGRLITGLCPFEQSSLIIAVGDEIIIHNLDMISRSWSVICRFNLPSPAASISAQGSLIYAATRLHSLIVLVKKDNKLQIQSADDRVRTTRHAVATGDTSFLTTAVRNGTSLIAFANRIPGQATEMCEVRIPSLVDEIQQYHVQHINDNPGIQFLSCATDGAVYRFTSLNQEEWRLLRYIESFCRQKRHQPIRNSSIDPHAAAAFIQPIATRSSISQRPKLVCRPADMHIHGDFLQDLLDAGLEAFLVALTSNTSKTSKQKESSTSIKIENGVPYRIQILKALIQGVPAIRARNDEELAGETFIWLRKLLNNSLD